MRVVQVVASMDRSHGGPPRVVSDIARHLASLDNANAVVAPRSSDWAPLPATTVVHRPLAFFRRSVVLSPAAVRCIKDVVRSVDADLVLHHGAHQHTLWAAHRAARATGVPLVIRPAGAFDPLVDAARPRLKRLATTGWQARVMNSSAIWVTSSRELSSLKGTSPRSTFVQLALGLGQEWFVDTKQPTGNPDRPLAVLFAGRFASKKNVSLIVDALKYLPASTQLVLMGPSGPAVPRVRESIAELKNPEQVTLKVGQHSSESVRRALDAADVFVLPSDGENWGKAVAEAMARGCAIVATRETDIMEHVLQCNGGVETEKSPSSIAAAIMEASASSPSMGIRAREYARSSFNWASILNRLEEEVLQHDR